MGERERIVSAIELRTRQNVFATIPLKTAYINITLGCYIYSVNI